MNSQLLTDKNSMASLLEEARQIAEKRLHDSADLAPSRWVQSLPSVSLPEKGMGASNTLAYFKEHYESLLNHSAGPRYFGFVTGGSTPAAVLGDQLVSVYDQNACGSYDSIAPQLEHQTIDFFKQLFALDADYFGSFVTGATMANFTGLALAREWAGMQKGIDASNEGSHGLKLSIMSGSAHSSIVKSLSMLGLGRNSLQKIETLADREAVDIVKLEEHIKNSAHPVVVVANAGTVNTVDFDDLQAIAELKKKYPFWLHVDAAFGGFATLSEKYKHLMIGINVADSITIDAHKWLNVPYDAAMQFTRHKNIQLRVFQNSAAYLGDPSKSPDFFHYTPENSRRWRALPSWFTLMAYGKEGHREIVERNCAEASRLGRWIEQSDAYQLLAPVRMNVICFSLKRESITAATVNEWLAAVRDDGRVFFTPTFYKGIPAIRAAVSNWQTESTDIDITINVLEKFSSINR